ncbi:MAG TPA: glycerol kinase GlpK [Rhodocyclaceae bacterium]|nr:glycerol kinase GlpK [Rhodocyclaceae bacterium]
MSCILALDQGTTSSRAILFDADGRIRSMAQREFRQYFPQPGWVEHDAVELWQSQIAVAAEAVRNAGIAAADVSAIGMTNQRETTVLWERDSGRPLHRAIVWQDRRTAAICERLRADGLEELFRRRTGLVLDPYFSATKLKWLLDAIPDARIRAKRGELAFGTVDSWLAWNLTAGRLHITDPSNASRTLLYDIHRGQWDTELLELLDIPAELLPEVRASSEVYACIEPHWLGAAIPLAGIAGDQQAATFGQGCLKAGMVKNTYGTGCFMLMNTGATPVSSNNRLLTTVAWRIGDTTHFALEGSVFMAGAIVQWLRDGLGLLTRADEIEALAAGVADSGGVVLVPAFAGLGAPWWRADARGAVFGMTRGTTKAHIARAALEAIACQTADVLTAMEHDAGVVLSELRVDGGACRNDMLMQMQADLLGVPIARPRTAEITALGAAGLAGLAVGLWNSPEELAALWSEERRFEPAMNNDERQNRLAVWRHAVEHAISY